MNGSPHQRAEPRESTLLKASVRVSADVAPVSVRVRNISAGGMMADCTLLLAKDQAVDIELRNIGWISGHIAWADGQRIGVAFVNAIDPHLVRKPVGTHATETMLVRRPEIMMRRPAIKSR